MAQDWQRDYDRRTDQPAPSAPPQNLIDALEEARADAAAGRVVSGEDVRAGLRAAIAAMRAEADAAPKR